jgi:hypothetical protein
MIGLADGLSVGACAHMRSVMMLHGALLGLAIRNAHSTNYRL